MIKIKGESLNINIIILLAFIAAKFAIQYSLIGPEYELHRDEFLHLDQGAHLAWGFLSVPPLTSWISYLISLLGNGVFWIKFFPALFGALTMVIVWKTIEELGGNLFALVLGMVSVLFSVILRINILYQPNSLDILFWTVLYFTVLKYINSQSNKWLWLAAITFAFGFLNKYNIAFLLLGLLPALLLTEHRKVLLNKQLYFAMALALLLILPNLVWQYQNNFPVIYHLNELASTQLANVNRLDFMKEQILFFFGSLFVLLAAMISLFAFKPFEKYRIFFWSFIFTLLIFIYFKAKGYYAIGLYPVLLAFGSVYIEKLLSGKWKLIFRTVSILLPVLLFIPMLRIAFPNVSPAEIQKHQERYKKFGLLRWEDGKDHNLPQDFADMQGWKELALKTDSAYNAITDKEHTLVLCDNYGQAGAINYYSKNKNINAVSFNADYINWFRQDKEIKNAILVKELNDDDPDREREKPIFETVTLSGEIINEYAREKGTKIYVLKNAKADINKRIREEIDRKKMH